MSDVSAPRAIGPEDPPWELPGKAPLVGKRLFMGSDETGHVYVMDISTPAAPRFERFLTGNREGFYNGKVVDMVFASEQVWVAQTGGLLTYVIDS